MTKASDTISDATTRIALGIQYDGSVFSGWQSQPHGKTVQDVLETALATFSALPRSTLRTLAAGRTDTGVHALGQVIHFDTPLHRPEHAWVRGVNTFLPPSVVVQWARRVPKDFHARFSALERVYYYVLYIHPIRVPSCAARAGWVVSPLDIDAMQRAAEILLGEHDFSAFRASQCQAKSPIKHLYALDIQARGKFIGFRFRANAFLHHMVRNIMGCLIQIGSARQTISDLQAILAERDRRLAAPTFMPDGLYFAQVRYPDKFEIPESELATWPWDELWRHE